MFKRSYVTTTFNVLMLLQQPRMSAYTMVLLDFSNRALLGRQRAKTRLQRRCSSQKGRALAHTQPSTLKGDTIYSYIIGIHSTFISGIDPFQTGTSSSSRLLYSKLRDIKSLYYLIIFMKNGEKLLEWFHSLGRQHIQFLKYEGKIDLKA